MITIYDTNQDILAKKAAKAFTNEITSLLSTKDQVVVAIPGGRSVVPFLQELKNAEINWNKVHFFMVDDRRVDLDHKDSNLGQAKKHFLDDLVKDGKIPEENIHPYFHEKPVEQYEAELKKFGEHFDIVVLGVGEDSHTAALYPNHHSVKNDGQYFVTLDDSPKPPPARMTASLKLIARSNVSFIFFIGEAKKEAYASFSDNDMSIEQCPAKVALQTDQTIVVTDLTV